MFIFYIVLLLIIMFAGIIVLVSIGIRLGDRHHLADAPRNLIEIITRRILGVNTKDH